METLRRLEADLVRADLDISGRLVAIHALAGQAADSPRQVPESTVGAFSSLLHDGCHQNETQVLSLYRAAADALAAVLAGRRAPLKCRRAAADALRSAMDRGPVPARRAAAEALGGLPLSVRGPGACKISADRVPRIGWRSVFKLAGIPAAAPAAVRGRSRIFAAGPERLFVVKEAATVEGGRLLAAEADWMVRLARLRPAFPVRFDIPEPLSVSGGHVFTLGRSGAPVDSRPARRAMAFFAHPDYFRYPNEAGIEAEALLEILERCSWLLGRLAAMGIVHTAPIPLFHNRAQAGRRADGGAYEWPRGGRLDRWLASSRYPNLAASGLRDFEHLEPIRRPGKRLFFCIGSHLLGLLLVGASFFRYRDSTRIGLDASGRPHDARDLFDPELLGRLIRRVLAGYFEGFTGRSVTGVFCFDPARLAARMIEEMGVDRHMEEILRAGDQKRLSAAQFHKALEEGGLPPERIAHAVPGRCDIPLATGPHLGGFNDRISLPEIIEFVQRGAAHCVCERFWIEREAACSGPGLH
ncbi:MAG: SidJ-related pseudokinase [Desulfobacterales bacterium]